MNFVGEASFDDFDMKVSLQRLGNTTSPVSTRLG